MSREWKPGDVAIRRARDGKEMLTVVVPRCAGCKDSHGSEMHWHHKNGGWDGIEATAWTTYRPLVVIDPEDREQVERLSRAFFDNMGGPTVTDGDNAMQAALRSLIAPPKPPEPKGLGAVIEDGDGVRWVRWSLGTPPEYAPWRNAEASPPCHRGYQQVTAVRILSEGVTE